MSDNGIASETNPLLYADAKAAVKQLTEAFGFTELAVYEGEDGPSM
ncbi:extradiol dioxygenase, partial [Streptomyces sp. NPDC056159]